jgi:bla regulator protein blaR1
MAAIDEFLTHQFVERLGWTLFHFLWQGALIALILLVTLRILHRYSPNARYLATGFALMSMVIIPVVTFVITGNARAKAAGSSFSPTHRRSLWP